MPFKVLGLGIITTGLMVLAVALIMGLEFPKYVSKETRKALCLTPASGEYKRWIHDRHRDRLNYVYFWHIKNSQAFLFEEAQADSGIESFNRFQTITANVAAFVLSIMARKVELRGPYVYRETGTKVGVGFYGGGVSFKEMTTQIFDQKLTSEKCGPTCTEQDELTVINTSYLSMVGKHGSTKALLLWYIPSSLRAAFKVIEAATNPISDDVYAAFGITLVGVLNDRMGKDASKNGMIPSFGEFIAKRDQGYKESILAGISNRNFTSVEMRGLYDALLSENTLGVATNRMADCVNTTYLLESYKLLMKNAAGGKANQTLLKCGLVSYLEKWTMLNADGSDDASALFSIVAELLCPNVTYSCLEIPPAQKSDYMTALAEYVLKTLPSFFLSNPVISKNLGVISTRTVNELAVGFNISVGDADHDVITYAPGVLENHTSVNDAIGSAAEVTLTTCADELRIQESLQWAGYKDKSHPSLPQFLPSADHRVHGLYMNHRPADDLRPCWHYSLASVIKVPVFLPPIWRTVSFRNDRTTTLHHGYESRRFTLGPDSAIFGGTGLLDMSGILQYQAWISQPNLQNTQSTFEQTTKGLEYTSYIDIEPITGAVWGRSLNFQLSAGINSTYISDLDRRSFKMNKTNQPIPVFRLDRRTAINREGIDHFRGSVSGFMTAACAGLITLTIPACLITLLGFVVAFVGLPSRKMRIRPEQREGGEYL